MKNEIKEYVSIVEQQLKAPETDFERLCGDMLTRIGFYQHERLVHLIVTMTFAIMTVLSFVVAASDIKFMLLAALFLALTIPYVWHYYFLENTVQKMYRLYYEALEKSRKNK